MTRVSSHPWGTGGSQTGQDLSMGKWLQNDDNPIVCLNGFRLYLIEYDCGHTKPVALLSDEIES